MSSIPFNLIIVYTVSFLGTIIYGSHIISTLLCLDAMILSTFVFGSLIILNSHYLLSFAIPIIILVFASVYLRNEWRIDFKFGKVESHAYTVRN